MRRSRYSSRRIELVGCGSWVNWVGSVLSVAKRQRAHNLREYRYDPIDV